ncbi:MAG: electron transfer flavoprotein-ubiquinone oxidoreductase [Steroidobacteraceae bacterium]
MTEREQMQYDYLIVGAGPAGLSCAIRLKQLKPEANICVLEKAATLGAHSISGAVLEPGPLETLLPGWRERYSGMAIAARQDEFRFLTHSNSYRLPVPPQMHNQGNLIVSLSQLTAWLGQQAEELGIDVFPGFAAALPLYDAAGAVSGVQIGDMGLNADGSEGANYTPGVEILANTTILAEGARGSLSKQLIARFKLDAGKSPPTFGLGFKELWQLPAGRVQPGLIQHSAGWPLDGSTYGGSFLYHLDQDRVYIGFVVGLDYQDPRFSPFEAFQQFKHHPSIKSLLEGGEILSAGARTIAAGGWQSLPQLEMPGALLIGDAGGTLNVPKIKGIHQAIRSGMCAAEHLAQTEATAGFDARWRASEGGQELFKVRNIKPGFKKGFWWGFANGALETLTGGRTPWTLQNRLDANQLKKLEDYTSPDRHWITRELPPRDRVSSVFFANNAHEESQPVHLKVADTNICATRCASEYGNPCERFCPAGVYEMVEVAGAGKQLRINAANCVHCKACDIKDPYGIITWTPPEGGSGPNYQDL